ncbi:hypothetical protein C6502_00540 [Candidatus Poribacteria bacterium]|nr:MAG: hypothetical protein C6502_00540 [Candidatus Poribacteria bacterium]
MKTVTILSLLLLASPAFGELTKEDLRTIIKEENAALEKRLREHIDLKIDAVDNKLSARIDTLDQRIDDANEPFDPFWIVMIIMLAAVILPQIIVLFLTIYDDIRERKRFKTEIQQLRERINALESTPSMNQ